MIEWSDEWREYDPSYKGPFISSKNDVYWVIAEQTAGYALYDILNLDDVLLGMFPTVDAAKAAAALIRSEGKTK